MQLIVLLLRLRVVLQLLLEWIVSHRRFARDPESPLHCRASVDALPPLVQIFKLLEVHARDGGEIDPAETRNIGDAELITDQIFAAIESDVEHAEKTLSFADVTLRSIWNTFFGESEEAAEELQVSYTFLLSEQKTQMDSLIRLALHRAQSTMLPRDPLLAERKVWI